MTDKLFDDPKKPDEFRTESPLRAFSSFDMKGSYLIAKGFRPSLGHLVNYLDAMEKKEGWQLLQILEAATGVPTMVFRQADDNVRIPDALGPHSLWLEATLREGIASGQTLKTVNLTWHEDKEKLPYEKPELHPLEAPYGDFTLTIKGLDPERVPWNRVQWRGEIEKLFEAARERPHHVKVKDFLRRENVTDMSHYYRTASVASVLRLIDMFEGWDAYALDEYISDDALFTAIGWTNPKAREACNADPYAAVAAAIRETEATSDPLADDTPAPKFDDANPEHYNGWECGDIGERLSANGYQILKYCWRLGKKDDPCKELGKALRYLDRELDLMKAMRETHMRADVRGIKPEMVEAWLYARINEQSDFTKTVAIKLWSGYNRAQLEALKADIADHKARLDCGHGLAI